MSCILHLEFLRGKGENTRTQGGRVSLRNLPGKWCKMVANGAKASYPSVGANYLEPETALEVFIHRVRAIESTAFNKKLEFVFKFCLKGIVFIGHHVLAFNVLVD